MITTIGRLFELLMELPARTDSEIAKRSGLSPSRPVLLRKMW